MRIAVDAMGAEQGIEIVIEGALEALKTKRELEIILVGKEEEIKEKLREKRVLPSPFSLVHAPEVIGMEESPTFALKNKKNSSISVGFDLLKGGKVEGMVSAGNTGAVVACALLKLGRLEGVKRPCLAVVLPTQTQRRIILLDVGANIDSKPIHLYQFAVMGSIYAYKVLKVRSPRVGLLNVGTEEGKGTELIKETYTFLKDSSLNFVGNIEGKDITSGKVDVAVCDGFIGNIILKFAEGFAEVSLGIIEKETQKAFLGLGGLFYGRTLRRIRKDLDYAEYGGAPLLGVEGVCVIAHGASSSKAIKNAILASFDFVKSRLNEHIKNALKFWEEKGNEGKNLQS